MSDQPTRLPVYGRVSRVVIGVIREALRTTGATGIVLMDDQSPEGELLTSMLQEADVTVAEYADAASTLTAHPANKTALLVGGFIPRVDLLPFGDLYASQVEELTGEWHADEGVIAMARQMGGIAALDEVLIRQIDNREPLNEMVDVPAAYRDAVAAAIMKTRFRRGRAGLVPKLGSRTIGIDLLD